MRVAVLREEIWQIVYFGVDEQLPSLKAMEAVKAVEKYGSLLPANS
jgi:hypothetical protein